jgi:DNA-binding transcriptional MerR regulator
MTVLEIAKACEVAPHIVRYYTRIGLLRPACNAQNGYRVYTQSDAARLRFIRRAQGLGFTLKEAAGIIDCKEQKQSPCPLVRRIIERRIEENRNKLQELTRLQARMEKAFKQWSGMADEVPAGDALCHLIESFDADKNGR